MEENSPMQRKVDSHPPLYTVSGFYEDMKRLSYIMDEGVHLMNHVPSSALTCSWCIAYRTAIGQMPRLDDAGPSASSISSIILNATMATWGELWLHFVFIKIPINFQRFWVPPKSHRFARSVCHNGVPGIGCKGGHVRHLDSVGVVPFTACLSKVLFYCFLSVSQILTYKQFNKVVVGWYHLIPGSH